MSIRNLEHAVRPKSVAVIGASTREGSVGRVVMTNIVLGGFAGDIYPVNPKYEEVSGRRCYRSVSDLPTAPDLAIIMTPPATVPGLIEVLATKGTRAAVVITAGLTRENGLRQQMLDAARPHLFRIIGPNTVGLMLPPLRLNASFAHMAPAADGIALLSQSGAIATSLVDWAAERNIGFSHIVSLGDMADVDVGDWLDMLAGDAVTRAVVMYLESVPNPRKFMSAARAAARAKPVIAIKAGRHAQAAKAAATHTGALSGADRVIDAALRRAGILRVQGLGELFDAAEITARFPPLERARVGIVTNGGGAGVLAVDRLVDCAGELAELSAETLAQLDAALPTTWSRANPVDIIGDAPPQRYSDAARTVADDPGCDAVLVLNCPTGLASPQDAARAIAALTVDGKASGKPVLTCWLGEHTAREGRQILQASGVATFDTPGDAAMGVSYLSRWSVAQRALMRVPSANESTVAPSREKVLAIFRAVAAEGRRMLTEPEAKEAIAAYGIPVPETVVTTTPEATGRAAERLLKSSQKVVVKLLSRDISHKSDIGGVVLNIETPVAAQEAAGAILARAKAAQPTARIDGLAVQPMVVRKHAHELIVGMNRDPIFGPALLFGAGGTAVEVMDDTAIGLPPLDDVLASDLIDATRIGRLLAGYRDRKPADHSAIIAALNAVSQLVVDFSCIVGLDINPLLANEEGLIALDARIEIDPGQVEAPAPNAALAIRPYPAGWQREFSAEGHGYHLRPIRPADIALYPPFLERISTEDIQLRFLAPRRNFPDDMLKRLTQLDYDRDMAFVAIDDGNGELAGIGRLSFDPDKTIGEFALLVRSDLQGHGIGRELFQQIIDYAKAEGVGRLEGYIHNDNRKMLALSAELGSTLAAYPADPALRLATLDLSGEG